MKSSALLAIVLVIALVAWLAWKAVNRREGTPSQAAAQPPSKTYTDLRAVMLEGSRTKFGLPETASPTQPWGVVIDWGIPRGIATVVAMSDGSASVYLSSGGGFLGGIGHENVRKAAQATVAAANEAQPQMHPTTTYPLPQRGEMTFYVLTDSGVFTESAAEAELKSNHSPLSRLGNAAQDVITQYRLMQSTK